MMTIERELKRYSVEIMAQVMAETIAKATGAEMTARVHEVTKPPPGEVH